jgi:Tol biopolymer transport system component
MPAFQRSSFNFPPLQIACYSGAPYVGRVMRISRVLLSILVLAMIAGVRADDFPIKKFSSFTWVVDYEPFWSPDSRQIVLVSSRHGGMKVHVMNADSASHGSDMRQLTFGSDEDDAPAWSPDGKKIAFVSIRAGVSQIFVMNSDGTNVRQLTSGNAENIHPRWAPDSERILFNTTKFVGATAADGRDVPSDNKVIGEQIDKKMDLATVRVDGTDLKRLTNGGGYTYASFSPDGSSILHRRVDGAKSQIFVMNADATNDHNISGENTLDGWPAWSNDGKRVVFSRRVNDRFQLFMMNRDGSGVMQLTDATGEFVNPRWSPDGKKIMCARRLGDMNVVIFPAPK